MFLNVSRGGSKDGAGKGWRVLAVGDDEGLRKLLVGCLRRAGFIPEEVSCGSKAVEEELAEFLEDVSVEFDALHLSLPAKKISAVERAAHTREVGL